MAFFISGYAEKHCRSDGTWFRRFNRRDGVEEEWTDFTNCNNAQQLKEKELWHVAFYTVSIAGLVPAIALFFSYK